jgi:di/tricarboxylate transporter
VDWIGRQLLGNAQTERAALWRMAIALISASAFVLNTALVAMMTPVVVDWCRRRNISPSRLLIPVSYLTILGGVCTLIGTSTSLVVNGQLSETYAQLNTEIQAIESLSTSADPQSQAVFEEQLVQLRDRQASVRPMRLLELSMVGVPCAIVGGIVLILLAPKILPNRTDLIRRLGDQRREYLVEMLVKPECRLIGKTIEEAGLRHLPGLFLIEIDRDGDLITPVSPDDRLKANDRLVFTGVVETIVDLKNIPGFVPAADLSYTLESGDAANRHLTEVVLSRTSPLVGTTVKKANFRERYNAVVIAVHRNGVRLTNKIGDIDLEPGDTLLLQTRKDFVAKYRNNREFFLVSEVSGSEPIRHNKIWTSGLLFLGLIVWLVVASLWGGGEVYGWASPVAASFTVVVLMILTRCLRTSEMRSAVDLQLVLVIASALGIGAAIHDSGAAEQIARAVTGMVGTNPWILLLVIYLTTVVLTEMISNTAVAAIMFPIALDLAIQSGHHPRPYIIAIAVAASLSFVTPIGYQTNLMVMGPGGYRPVDYLRAGLPLAIAVAITALLVIPICWQF